MAITLHSTHQPFPVALQTLLVKLLHCNDHAGPRLRRPERLLIDPTLEHRAKAATPEHAVGAEVACGCLELAEAEVLYVGRLQDIGLAPGRGGI